MDIGNSLDWEFVARGARDGSSRPIQPETFTIDATHLKVAIKVPTGKTSWYRAGWLTQYTFSSPSPYGEFVALTSVKNIPLRLGNYQLVELKDIQPKPYLIKLAFPDYFTSVLFEVWRYNP